MNNNLDAVIICPLTTKIKTTRAACCLKTHINNLPKDSEVLTFHIRSASKERFIKKIGDITVEELKQIKFGLIDILHY